MFGVNSINKFSKHVGGYTTDNIKLDGILEDKTKDRSKM